MGVCFSAVKKVHQMKFDGENLSNLLLEMGKWVEKNQHVEPISVVVDPVADKGGMMWGLIYWEENSELSKKDDDLEDGEAEFEEEG